MSGVVNCTPHSVAVYGPDAVDADGCLVAGATLIASYPPSGHIARLQTSDLGPADAIDSVPVRRQELGRLVGLPKPVPGVWYIVSLACAGEAVAAGHARILVPGGQVRARGADGRPGAVVGATYWITPVDAE